jgi:thiol-disulfide isomerase/thioredoxin
LLAQSVVRDFGGRARFVVENYGSSELARRNGVTFYPALFVDDILVATPRDFYNPDEAATGRYIPFKTAASHERFREDLSRMIALILAGRKDAARAEAAPAATSPVESLPAATITDLDGRPLTRADLAGRAVVVEMWATWCPPCRGSLAWLGGLRKRYGDRLAVVALAVKSEEPQVRRVAGELGPALTWAMSTPQLLKDLGDVTSVPTLLLFGRDGRAAGAFYGAPPTLHAEVEGRLATLLE